MLGALLIDFDGVLRVWDAAGVERIEEQAGLPPGAIRQAAFAPDLLRPALVGHMSDEAWRGEVAARLRADFPQAQADRAVALWSASPGAIDPGVLSLIQPCRAQAQVVLVTNGTTRLASDLARLGLTGAFDHIINSSEIGYAKPEPEVFAMALAAAGVSGHEALFVDDDRENVEAATALGIAGHHFRDATGLRGHLGQLGVFAESPDVADR